MTLDLRPFTDDLLPAAADLLAQRHRAHRSEEPLLPARFEEPAAALKAVEAIWSKNAASGVTALDGERLVGFMIGTAHHDSLRGRHVWVPLAGHAVAPDADAELYRDLYAMLAREWVDEGYFYHLAQVPASDAAALDAWFRLTFAHEQVHGIRALEPAERPPMPAGVEVRRARPEDLEAIMEVADWIGCYQAGSPVFGICLPEAPVGWRKGWTALLADSNVAVWLLVKEGRIMAFHAYDPALPAEENLMVPGQCVYLDAAATRPDARGQGFGRLLTTFGFAAAHEMGFRCCLTDWRAANLLSSRFWPRQGFRPVVYRLSRRIDPRIAWARGGGRGWEKVDRR